MEFSIIGGPQMNPGNIYFIGFFKFSRNLNTNICNSKKNKTLKGWSYGQNEGIVWPSISAISCSLGAQNQAAAAFSDKASKITRNNPVSRNSFSGTLPRRTNACPPSASISSAICLATASSTLPAAGKLSVLLQTSAVCIFAYWIANIVVPGFIMKDLKSKRENENGENRAEDEQ